MLNTPILFLIFNRPDTTRQVFAKIREAQPKQLFIAADGPRIDKPEDNTLCVETKMIVEHIDWDCEVHRLYATENLGFSIRIKSALKWFFENVEMGIILEDDCVPSNSFFKFCELTLERHKNNEEIQLISGSNFCDKPISKTADYFIADFGYIWGWATWRRAFNSIRWQTEYNLADIKNKLHTTYKNEVYVNHFYAIIEHYYNKKDCWDVEFFVYAIMNNKKKILPNVNLISNIGNSGTHYANSENKLLNTKTFEIDFNKFDVNNYTAPSDKQIKMVINQFNKKEKNLTLRDRIYIFRIKIQNLLKQQ